MTNCDPSNTQHNDLVLIRFSGQTEVRLRAWRLIYISFRFNGQYTHFYNCHVCYILSNGLRNLKLSYKSPTLTLQNAGTNFYGRAVCQVKSLIKNVFIHKLTDDTVWCWSMWSKHFKSHILSMLRQWELLVKQNLSLISFSIQVKSANEHTRNLFLKWKDMIFIAFRNLLTFKWATSSVGLLTLLL